MDARPFLMEDIDDAGVRSHKEPKGNPKICFGRRHKGRLAETRRELGVDGAVGGGRSERDVG